jgi:hypothetical protein
MRRFLAKIHLAQLAKSDRKLAPSAPVAAQVRIVIVTMRQRYSNKRLKCKVFHSSG